MFGSFLNRENILWRRELLSYLMENLVKIGKNSREHEQNQGLAQTPLRQRTNIILPPILARRRENCYWRRRHGMFR